MILLRSIGIWITMRSLVDLFLLCLEGTIISNLMTPITTFETTICADKKPNQVFLPTTNTPNPIKIITTYLRIFCGNPILVPHGRFLIKESLFRLRLNLLFQSRLLLISSHLPKVGLFNLLGLILEISI